MAFGQDNEVGLENLTVELVDASGEVVAITHTDKHGEYWFDLDYLDLPYPATYEIRENTSDILVPERTNRPGTVLLRHRTNRWRRTDRDRF